MITTQKTKVMQYVSGRNYHEYCTCPFCYEPVTGVWQDHHLKVLDHCVHFMGFCGIGGGSPGAMFEGPAEQY